MQNNLVLLNEKQKKPLAEQSVLHTVFLENEAQINQELCFSCPNKSACQNLARSCRRNEHRAKAINALSARKLAIKCGINLFT